MLLVHRKGQAEGRQLGPRGLTGRRHAYILAALGDRRGVDAKGLKF